MAVNEFVTNSTATAANSRRFGIAQDLVFFATLYAFPIFMLSPLLYKIGTM